MPHLVGTPIRRKALLLHAEPVRRWRYYTLDDFDVLQQVERGPTALWASANEIVMDEV